MIRPQRNDNDYSDLSREINYTFMDLQERLNQMLPNLMLEQRTVFHTVMNKVNSNVPALLFLDAPGGTGKTFLLNILLKYFVSGM